MLKSMTAYASMELSEHGLTVGVEIRTYNSRYLDLSLRLPSGYAGLEEKIKTLVNAQLVRGRAEVRITVKETAEAAGGYEVDAAKAKAFLKAALALKQELGLQGEVPLEMVLNMPGVIQKIENTQAAEDHWPLMERCLGRVLAAIDQMRRKEGEHIGEDFNRRLEWMESQLQHIEAGTSGVLEQYRDKLLARIEDLTQGATPLDAVRIAQEAALMADRSDISEEIVRVKSHIAQFRGTMQGADPAGRKLNFLLQEFNREFNTMGSKAAQAELAHTIVAVKAEIEKLREQVQNVE